VKLSSNEDVDIKLSAHAAFQQ